MTDLEQVIAELLYLKRDTLEGSPTDKTIDKAIALLKAQEPRVMTLEEIPYAVFGWMEVFGQLIPCVLEDVYVDDTVGFANIEDGHDYMCASDYGKTWRCWTSCPTDEQMEVTPWN